MSPHKFFPTISSSKDIIHQNFTTGKQTFIIPLTFPDIRIAAPLLPRISYGGDIWELRVDLLSASSLPLGSTNLPSPAYVTQQVQALQSMSPLPILFTIRTQSQGGKFPDDAVDEALQLMLLAVRCGVQYIDVEIEWPEALVSRIMQEKGDAMVVASYHSWTGDVGWTSEVLREKFRAADAFGDIIKLSILSATINDCHELALFVRNYVAEGRSKPLLAVGMGANGQLSRITSPISLVTHSLIPFPSAPGQLTLAQVHQALYLIGQLPKKQFYVLDEQGEGLKVRNALEAAFRELGYPHTCEIVGKSAVELLNGNGPEVVFDVGGRVLLAERICEQFEKWTGRPAPVITIEDALKRHHIEELR